MFIIENLIPLPVSEGYFEGVLGNGTSKEISPYVINNSRRWTIRHSTLDLHLLRFVYQSRKHLESDLKSISVYSKNWLVFEYINVWHKS